MKKLVCPCCGWSNFIKYDGEETIFCLACGLECTEYEVLKFEQANPDENGNYGITVIDEYRKEYKKFNGHRSDAYYEEWIKKAEEREAEKASVEDPGTRDEDENDWEPVVGPTPFDQ